MTKLRPALILSAAIAAFLFFHPARVNTQRAREQFNGHEVVPGEVLVRVSNLQQLVEVRRQTDASDDRPIGNGEWRRIRSNTRTVQALIQILAARGDVDVEPNYILEAIRVPDDPSLSSLWGLAAASPGIHAATAWDLTTGSPSTVVGVVDTGIDYNHPDLAANVWSAPTAFTVTVGGSSITCPAGSHGFNAIQFTCDPADDHGHGTHVSGTIGAIGNNTAGVVGVNWQTRIMGLKFLDATGSGSTSDAINAIDFAIQAKAFFASSGGANVRVLSNSYGGGGYQTSFFNAIGRANSANMLFAAAAGNNGLNNDAVPFYPASYPDPNVLAVAASDQSDGLAGFSNYGAHSVHLAAPGVNILSTTPGNTYSWGSGTSMATPHVSGAAALVLSACPQTTSQLVATLLNSVDAVPAFAGITVSGGRLNVDRAVRSCATLPTITLNSPSDGATYAQPAQIALSAMASDPDGISKVEFYDGTKLISTSTAAPYGGTWSNVALGGHDVTAVAYDMFGLASASTTAHVTVNSTQGSRQNVAAAANGGVATASSSYNSGYAASGAINGDRKGLGWGSGGGWNDGTSNAWPDWLEVDFNGAQTINEIDVFSVQDSFQSPIEPTSTMTFSQYGLTDFQLQYWDGTQWTAVPGGTISANTLVWRQVMFASVTTTRIRLWVTGGLNNWTRVTEVEAYATGGPATMPPTVQLTSPLEGASYAGPAPINLQANASDSDGTVTKVDFYVNGGLVNTDLTSPYATTWTPTQNGNYTVTAQAWDNSGGTTVSAPVHITVTGLGTRVNVAAAANGGVATASSSYNSGYAASGAINGDRKGLGWGSGGGWNDGTSNAWPDWLEVDFNGAQTINEIDVFSVQDSFQSPIEPTSTMTFSQYGLTDFQLQYWDGTQWTAVPGGTISANTLVWRQVMFASVTTTRIRLWVTGGLNNWTRVTEVEAYATGGPATMPPTVQLTSPLEGASYAGPAPINLQANASDSDGTVTKVDFYVNGGLVNTDLTSPYATTWTPTQNGNYTVTAQAWDNSGGTTVSAPVHITVTGLGTRVNVAAAANGGVATASSSYNSGYAASGAINGDRKGLGWGSGGGWNDGTSNAWPDWLEVDFNGAQTINEIDVFSVQDSFQSPIEPTSTMTFSQYGLTDFQLQYWDGTQWTAVPGGTISANTLVWRQVMFASVTTTKIRVYVTGAQASWSRIVEVEAYSTQ